MFEDSEGSRDVIRKVSSEGVKEAVAVEGFGFGEAGRRVILTEGGIEVGEQGGQGSGDGVHQEEVDEG